MTSILNNIAANTALLNLENTVANLNSTQNEISTGLRVSSAADNASYFSIATVLRSDSSALSTVSDTLNLGNSSLSVASNALMQIQSTLSDIKNQLLEATQSSQKMSTIQQSITQDQEQLQNTANSANFNGENFLSVNSSAVGYNATQSFVSSYSRDSTGAISIGYIDVNVADAAVFDTGVNAAISATPGTGQTVAGTVATPTGNANWAAETGNTTGDGTVVTPLTSNGPLSIALYSGDTNTGTTSFSTNLTVQGATTSSVVTDTAGTTTTGATQDAGLTAAQLAANGDVAGEVATSKNFAASWAATGNGLGTLTFYVAQNTDGAAGAAAYTYDKVIVTNVGQPGGYLDQVDTTTVGTYTDANKNTTTTSAGTGVSIMGIDISTLTDSAQDLAKLNAYEQQVDAAIQSVTTAASTLGTAQKRIQAQASFVSSLQTSINNGVGTLVDADMDQASTRLQALQVQQQLGVQSLSIANQSAQAILKLFQ